MLSYSILDIGEMDKATWSIYQPFYKSLATSGYFTSHLRSQDFTTAFYEAISHPLPFGKDPHLHLESFPLCQKEIIYSFFFQVDLSRKELYLLMVNVTYKGLFAVLFQILLQLCKRFYIDRISLMDRSFYGDPWSHYNFSGSLHDEHRVLYLRGL